jgi:chromosome segregation ATPase
MSNENITQEKQDARSFEERVFARFDALDARLDSVESRLNDMESRLGALEAKQYDTKPIWERALAEIADLRTEMNQGIEKLSNEVNGALRKVEDKIDVLNENILDVRADQRDLKRRVETLEKTPA